jgi:hypothetical protein
MNALEFRHAASRGYIGIVMATLIGTIPAFLPAQQKPAAKPAVPAKVPAKATAPAVAKPGGRPGETPTHSAHGDVTRGPHRDVRDVHAHGMDIHHGPGGSRTIERERADHSRVVSDRYGHGYIQRPYMYHGTAFVHRTYYVGGVAYGRVYQPYMWGRISMNVYAPGFYYGLAFYSYAYAPWATPIAFGWGWAGNPWYGYYGSYLLPTRSTPAHPCG